MRSHNFLRTVVRWETDSLRFMRLHNCWVIKAILEHLESNANKMETHGDVFTLKMINLEVNSDSGAGSCAHRVIYIS